MKKLFIMLAAIIVLAGVAGGGWYFLNKKNKSAGTGSKDKESSKENGTTGGETSKAEADELTKGCKPHIFPGVTTDSDDFLPAALQEVPPKTKFCSSNLEQTSAIFYTKLSVPEVRDFYNQQFKKLAGCTFSSPDPDLSLVRIDINCDDGHFGGVIMQPDADFYTVGWATFS